MRGLDDDRQINPSIVVKIDGGHAPPTLGIGDGQGHAFKALAITIPPQRDTRRPGMGQGYIHPAILVEVENVDTDSGGKAGDLIEGRSVEVDFARIGKKSWGRPPARYNEIDGTVIIYVGQDSADCPLASRKAGLHRPVSESAVAVVAPENVRA